MIQFNKIKKEVVLTTQSFGTVIRKGIVFDVTNHCKREVDMYTLIKVIGFNFFTRKINVACVKGMETYQAEVTVDFLMSHCQIETPEKNKEVEAIYVQHVVHNLLDKDTAIFIVVMTLTYLVGLVLGKGL